MASAKSQELETQLERAVKAGALTGYTKKSTGNELIWQLDLPANGATLELKTREAGLLLLGIDVGRQLGQRSRKAHPVRDAIAADGAVTVPLSDPDDARAVKSQRNALFGHAYALGLKGSFSVKRVGDTLVGSRT
jgi:hypothetical protein